MAIRAHRSASVTSGFASSNSVAAQLFSGFTSFERLDVARQERRALVFSHQVSKDTERNAAAVPLRYTGKTFIIDGTVDYVTKDGDAYRVAYKIPHPHEEILRLPNTAPFKTDIMCMMAKGQAAYTLQLNPRKSIKLIGTFDAFSETRHVFWMNDCRPAK